MDDLIEKQKSKLFLEFTKGKEHHEGYLWFWSAGFDKGLEVANYQIALLQKQIEILKSGPTPRAGDWE